MAESEEELKSLLLKVKEENEKALMMNYIDPDVQAKFRKGIGTRNQIANICWIIKKARVTEKHIFLLY